LVILLHFLILVIQLFLIIIFFFDSNKCTLMALRLFLMITEMLHLHFIQIGHSLKSREYHHFIFRICKFIIYLLFYR